MKIAFICESLFHVLTCINYTCNQKEYTDLEIDVYIREIKSIDQALIKRVYDTGLFRSVIGFNYGEDDKEFQTKLDKLSRYLFPKKYIKKWIRYCFGQQANEHYNYVYTSFPNHFSREFAFVHSDARIRFYEDGVGSYINSIPLRNTAKIKWMFLLKGKNNPWKNIDRMYVYRPELCDEKTVYPLGTLPIMGKEKTFRDIIQNVFCYSPTEHYLDRQIVFLTQPGRFEYQRYEKNKQALLTLLQDFFIKDTVLRLHPRDETVVSDSFEIDKGEAVWELVCADEISDNHILIAFFSTTQFIPKFMYDTEPYLVFLFPTEDTSDKKEWSDSMYSLTDRVKKIYRNPEKIILLQNISDLKPTLKGILDEKPGMLNQPE